MSTSAAAATRATTAATPKRSAQPVERPTQAPDAALSATARQLLDSAEQLFAQRGLEGVSLRELVAASGQRNLSAAQYHFGSREKLLGMLLARRVYVINQLRHARLDGLVAAGRADDPQLIVRTSTEVLAEAVRDQPWGPDYVRVAAQALMHPGPSLSEDARSVYWSGHARVQQMLRRLLPRLPEDLFRDRLRIVNNEIVFALARWVQVHGPVSVDTRARFDALVRHTGDFLAAGMVAPSTARSRRSSS